MARNYKRKTNRSSYSKEKLLDAVRAVQNGQLSGYKAARIYNIPRMTIMDHVKNKRYKSSSLGRPTSLSVEIENKLATYLHIMERYGFGLSRDEVLEIVAHYVNANKIQTPFKNGKPGKDWFVAFRDRNNLSVKKPQAVEYARKRAVDPYVIYPYFDLLQKTIEELGLTDKPQCIWNLDETSFSKDPSKTKIVGRKGYAATRNIASPGKDNTTVLLAANAIGVKVPPLIVFKGKNVWDQWTSAYAYPQTTYAATINGWMETEVFENYFIKSFLPALGAERPQLLIFDGHSTHVGISIMEKAQNENVTIIKLPAHTSHILQPLDLSVMKSFKDRWDSLLVKWQRLNVGVPLPKSEFSRLIGSVWAQIDPIVIRNGFQKAGIYPLNKRVIDDNLFETIKLNKWRQHINNSQPDSNTVILQNKPKRLGSIVLDFITKNMMTTEESSQNQISNVPKIKPVNFEELLLTKVNYGEIKKNPRRKIAQGAEVITNKDVIERKRELQLNNIKSEKTRLPITSKVSYLNKLSRNDEQMRPFAANNPCDLPSCLEEIENIRPSTSLTDKHLIKMQRKNYQMKAVAVENSNGNCMQNMVSDASKIKILSNVLIKPASSKSNNQLNTNTKGKGIGKRSRNKENIPLHSKNMHFKRKLSSSRSSTSVSGSISSHSDSSLIDLTPDDEWDRNEIIEDYKDTILKRPANEFATRSRSAHQISEIAAKLPSDSNEQLALDPLVNELYYVEDRVLVRYYVKNNWTYYVGVVENATVKNNELYYCIRFFKTIKKPNLMFKNTKIIDRDAEVPQNLIIKKIELVPGTSNEYLLADEGDTIFFI